MKLQRVINSDFGIYLDLDPRDSDVAIICEWTDKGLVPVSICLVHQVYLKKIDPAKKYCVYVARTEQRIDFDGSDLELLQKAEAQGLLSGLSQAWVMGKRNEDLVRSTE